MKFMARTKGVGVQSPPKAPTTRKCATSGTINLRHLTTTTHLVVHRPTTPKATWPKSSKNKAEVPEAEADTTLKDSYRPTVTQTSTEATDTTETKTAGDKIKDKIEDQTTMAKIITVKIITARTIMANSE